MSRRGPAGLNHAASFVRGLVQAVCVVGGVGVKEPVVLQQGPHHTGAASSEGNGAWTCLQPLTRFLRQYSWLGPSRTVLVCAER